MAKKRDKADVDFHLTDEHFSGLRRYKTIVTNTSTTATTTTTSSRCVCVYCARDDTK